MILKRGEKMPNIKSAKKRVLTSERKCQENILVDSRMKNSIKKLEKTIKEGKKEESQELLKTTFKNIDKAQDINIVHPNKAARLKSRLSKSVNGME